VATRQFELFRRADAYSTFSTVTLFITSCALGDRRTLCFTCGGRKWKPHCRPSRLRPAAGCKRGLDSSRAALRNVLPHESPDQRLDGLRDLCMSQNRLWVEVCVVWTR